MLKDISKKLTMKKTFFTTQLEGFFNSITQEYQTIIHELEVEKRVVEEKVAKLEKDVENLVQIKKNYEKSAEIDKRRIKDLQNSLATSSSAYSQTLQSENEALKKKLASQKEDDSNNEEMQVLKDKITKLQGVISKGANPYNENIISEQKDDIIKEISESLKK